VFWLTDACDWTCPIPLLPEEAVPEIHAETQHYGKCHSKYTKTHSSKEKKSFFWGPGIIIRLLVLKTLYFFHIWRRLQCSVQQGHKVTGNREVSIRALDKWAFQFGTAKSEHGWTVLYLPNFRGVDGSKKCQSLVISQNV